MNFRTYQKIILLNRIFVLLSLSFFLLFSFSPLLWRGSGVFSQIRTTVATGSWTTAATWDCSCVPGTTEDAVITSPFTVTLTGATTIANLTINSGATVNDNNAGVLIVTGNLVVNGTHTGQRRLDMTGVGTTLSGTGVINTTGALRLDGNVTVLSTTDLTKSAGIMRVGTGVTVTNNGIFTCFGNITAFDATSTWTNAANSTLNAGNGLMVGGVLNASAAGNTVNYYRAGNQNVVVPSGSTYTNLKIEGSATKTLLGNITVTGNLTINSGTFDVSTFNINIGGNYSNAGTLTENIQTITFNGSGDQQITNTLGETFYDLVINKSGGVLTLNNNVIASNILTMTAGTVSTGSNKITVGTSTLNTGTLTFTAGTIAGKYEKWINATGTYLLPVGNISNYRPASTVINTLVTGGSLIGEFISSAPGNNGLPLVDGFTVYNTFVEGYWTLTTANSFSSTNYNLDITGNGFTTYTITPETRLLRRTTSANPWSVEGTHVAPTGNTIKRTGLTTISSEYAFGDTTNCLGPTTSAITGTDSVCTSAAGIAYSVTNTPGSTYTWTITGGTQASGGTTNAITVNWGSTGGTGTVQVVENNGCSNGAPVTYSVSIHSMPTSSITGRAAVPANTLGEPYSVTSRPGYTYTWTITGGTQASGGTTNSITVNWGPAGSGDVAVVASSACGAAPSVNLAVYIYVVINSVATGMWNNTAAWDCSCVPSSIDNVVIKNTHTITLDVNRTISNFTIDAGGLLADGARTLTVNGDCTVNGTYSGSNNFTVNGSGNVISGIGTITTSGIYRLAGGSKTIAASASLTVSPGVVSLIAGSNCTNNGRVVIGGALTATTAASTWTNSSNSTLIAGGAVLTTGNLVASASGNLVEYNGAIGQTVKPVDYYNLSTTGISTTTLSANANVDGNLIIGPGNTLTTNNFNMNVAGNWTNSGGTFNEGTGTVTFDGTGTQTITATAGETFYNLSVPSGKTVNVVSGTTVTVSNTLTNTGTLDNDGTLNLALGYSGQTGTLKGTGSHRLTGGNWNNSTGTFTVETSTVEFAGAVAQTLTAATIFTNLTINNAAGVSVSSGVQSVTGTVTLTAGLFSTANNLVLVSNASGTGRIAQITGGSISGDVEMQRFIPAGTKSWRQISSACSGQSIASWSDDFYTSGFTGSTDPTMAFKSIQYYDETVLDTMQAGWTAVTNTTNAIVNGRGYMAYIDPAIPLSLLETKGIVNTGTIGLPVTFSSTGVPADDGWNLVGNPYPSSINWDAGGWTKTAINTTVYVWNPSTQTYASYTTGGPNPGPNGGSPIIPSSQAFWVQASGAPTLTIVESTKSATNQAFMKTTPEPDLIKLRINKSNGYYDEIFVQLKNNATKNYDPGLEAIKLFTTNNKVPQISFVTQDNINLAYSCIPVPVATDTIPIELQLVSRDSVFTGGSTKFLFPGTFTFTTEGIVTVPLSSCVLFKDPKTGITKNLRTDTTYTFTIPDTFATKTVVFPFYIYLTPSIEKQRLPVSCTGKNDGVAIAKGTGSGPWSYEWLNEAGTVLKSTASIFSADSISNLIAGTYTVKITDSNSLCGILSDTIVITEPNPIQPDKVISPVTCSGKNNGAVNITVNSDNPPYSFSWSNSKTTEDIDSLSAGTYLVTVTDSKNCSVATSYIVPGFQTIATFTKTDITCYGKNDGFAIASASSGISPYTYQWSNGDSVSLIGNLTPGTYSLTVTDSNGCTDTNKVVINEPAIVKAGFSVSADTVLTSQVALVTFSNSSTGSNSFIWDFGDNSLYENDENPSHLYEDTGEFSVTLVSSNETCSDTISHTVVVLEYPLSVSENLNENEEIQVIKNAEGTLIILYSKPYENTVVSVSNALGQKIVFDKNISGKAYILLDNQLPKGVYFLSIVVNNEIKSYKIVN